MSTIKNQNFFEAHLPQSISDLVIADPQVRSLLEQYAAGNLSSHVLFYGPPGSGKTLAARTASRLRNIDDDGKPGPVVSHPAVELNQRGNLDAVRGAINFQRMCVGPDPIIVMDEIDQLNDNLQYELRDLIDDHPQATFMATTNHLHRVQEPLRDRFDKYEVVPPSRDDWRTRVETILTKEGFQLTPEQVDMLLENWSGSARDLMRHLEKFCRA